ncbi:MAG: glycosyltransferase [Bdellovibrionales bacterium]
MTKIDEESIVIFIADLESGGAQKVAVGLARDLVKSGRRVTIVTLQGGKTDFHALPDGVARLTLENCNRYKGLRANLCRIIALRRVLKDLRAQAIISFIAPSNVLAIWAGFGLKTRVIISERNDPARQSFGRFWDILRVMSYRFADCVTANSQNAVFKAKQYVSDNKMHFIPNGLSDVCDDSVSKECEILIVGRLHPQKNHKILLQAFEIISKNYNNWRLVIAGDGALRGDLIKQSQGLKISNKADFLGLVKDPAPLYARASIFVLPSLHEGTPNALLEAMSHGVPPIISDACEGAFPYVTDGISGLIVPVNDVTALANAIEGLIIDENFRQDIGIHAKKAVKPLMGDAVFKQWEALLDNGGAQ